MSANENHGLTDEIETLLHKINIHTELAGAPRPRGMVFVGGNQARGEIHHLVGEFYVVDIGHGNQLAIEKRRFLLNKVPHVLGHVAITQLSERDQRKVLAELKKLPTRAPVPTLTP